MKVRNGYNLVTITTIVLGSFVSISTNALANGQTKVAVDVVDRSDCGSTDTRIDDGKHQRMIQKACHEERDKKKVHRFAHEARLEASKYKVSDRRNTETI